MNSHGSFIIALSAFLIGCAVQTANQKLVESEDLLSRASALNNYSPTYKQAEQKLSDGRSYLKEARYDLAIKSFEDSSRLSRLILKDQVPEQEKPAVSSEDVKVAAPGEAIAKEEAPKEEAQSQEVKEPSAEKKKVVSKEENVKSASKNEAHSAVSPLTVLENYLSQKRQAKEEGRVVAPPTVRVLKKEEKAPTPPPSTSPSTSPAPSAEAQPPVANEKMTSITEELQDQNPSSDAREDLSPDQVVEVPATRDFRQPPPRPEPPPSHPPPPPRPQVQAVQPPSSGMQKTAIPGVLRFDIHEEYINDQIAPVLDQTGLYLKSNPSVTLILQPTLAPNESPSLVETRFQAIQSYLRTKGVPDDQVRLDPQRLAGAVPQFSMFIIEH